MNLERKKSDGQFRDISHTSAAVQIMSRLAAGEDMGKPTGLTTKPTPACLCVSPGTPSAAPGAPGPVCAAWSGVLGPRQASCGPWTQDVSCHAVSHVLGPNGRRAESQVLCMSGRREAPTRQKCTGAPSQSQVGAARGGGEQQLGVCKRDRPFLRGGASSLGEERGPDVW